MARSARTVWSLADCAGPWQTVYSRFRTWTLAGVWEKVLSALIAEDLVEETTLMLDSTGIRVHQHAGSEKEGVRQSGAAGEV